MKKAVTVLLIFQIVFCTVTASAATTVGGNYVSSAGACVMDCETGDVLFEYAGYTPRVPASLTKLMTIYCVYEAMANGEISLSSTVPISKSVYYKSRNKLYQNMVPLNYNTVYTVDELMNIALVHSASAATVALAEFVGGGSEANFVSRMNNTARSLGLSAYYYDSCGVADNRISPVSMAVLARTLVSKYPDVINRTSKRSVYFHGATYRTTNHLLDTYYYAGADGLKTGTGTAAGACFCGTAVRGGRRLISVTLGSSSAGQRFTDTINLLNYGFKVAAERYNCVDFTNMRTFINGNEMPTFYHGGSSPHAVVIAEDMANYGFDVSFDDASRTLHVVRNYEKGADPIPLDIYKNRNGEKAFSVLPSDIKVVLTDGNYSYTFADAYNVGGYMCISIDEFNDMYDFVWNSAESAAYVTTVN